MVNDNGYVVVAVVQSLGHVQLFVTPWTTACQAFLSLIFSQSLPKLCPLNQWCHPFISSSAGLFSFCLRSFPVSRPFPMSWLFSSGGQGIVTSASVLPMNIQGLFLLGWTGLISLRDSQESSLAPQFKGINSLALSLLYGPTLTSIHDYWKNHSFDYMDLCRQSDVSAF